MKVFRKTFIALLLCIFTVACIFSGASKKADILLKAYNENALIPVLSQQYPNLDVKTAYKIQKAYVEKRLGIEKIAGFKAGLTSTPGQKKFNISEPIAGVLFEFGKKHDGAVIDTVENMMIETEIGFLIGKTITEPIEDIQELKNSLQAVMPVIELPNLGFQDMKTLKGVDLIAANACASQFIIGEGRPIDNVDINTVKTFLVSKEGQINFGRGSDALGDQLKAALWLINNMVNQGYTIEQGNIIITGALGKMVPGNIGKYTAYYGSTLGRISFEIK